MKGLLLSHKVILITTVSRESRIFEIKHSIEEIMCFVLDIRVTGRTSGWYSGVLAFESRPRQPARRMRSHLSNNILSLGEIL